MENFTAARQWMTDLLDHPEKHMTQILVIVGGKETGKSIFAKMLSNYVENENMKAAIRNPAQTVARYMLDNRLVVLDEPASNWLSWLQPIVAEPQVHYEPKGAAGFMIENQTGFVVLTYSFDPAPHNRRCITLKPLQALAILADI